MTSHIKFPYEIKNVTEEEDKIIRKYYKGFLRPFIRTGPEGYLLPPRYADIAEQIYNVEVRPDDIWVVTFARSGTTWIQELAWLIGNNLDFSNKTPRNTKYAFIEHCAFPPDIRKPSKTCLKATEEDFSTIHMLPSPRFMKTHMPLSLLPPKLLDTAKVFYVARDTRDVAVSLFFMQKMFGLIDEDVEFKEYWQLFKNNLVQRTPILPHVEEAWQKRNHPNMMFLFYEEMQKVKDMRSVIDRVCSFMGKEYTDEQKQRLAEHVTFGNMRTHPENKFKQEKEGTELQFMRKGKSGNWVSYFDEQMKQEAEEYMNKHFQTTDMRFPQV